MGQGVDRWMLPLFVPADRPERFAKAVHAGADAVIIDLEDAVPANQKEAALAALAVNVAAVGSSAVDLIVRINAPGTAWFERDLVAIANIPTISGIVLPKAETAADVDRVRAVTGKAVVALIETARGLRALDEVSSTASRLAFGSVDFSVDLGMAHTSEALSHARWLIVMASRLAGLPGPIDGVTVELRDAEKTAADARHAASLGFSGKLLIHPDQIAPARMGFAPTETEREWASKVIARSAETTTAAVDGAMIDPPVIKQAERILARHELSMGARR